MLSLVPSVPPTPPEQTLHVLGRGVYALTGTSEPNVGAIEGEDFLVVFDARPTTVATGKWVELLRTHTDKPIKYLVLSHHHALRTMGAAAFGAETVIAHANAKRILTEHGRSDWAHQLTRAPELFPGHGVAHEPALALPTMTFNDRLSIELGGNRGTLVLAHVGRGHTAGDAIMWLPKQGIVFAGDLVEAEETPYTGDAFHEEWSTDTLDWVLEFGAETLVGGRGAPAVGMDAVDDAVEHTREYLMVLRSRVSAAHLRGRDLRYAFEAARRSLEPLYRKRPLFESFLPYNVQRMWDELDGVESPRPWTAERDQALTALVA